MPTIAATPAGSTMRRTAEARLTPIGPLRTNMEAQLEATHCKVARTTPVRTKLAKAPANVMSPIAAAREVAAEGAVLAAGVGPAVAAGWGGPGGRGGAGGWGG